MRWSRLRCRKSVTQLSDGSFLAISEAKLLIIVLVGGKWRSVSLSIYSTSSASCVGVSNRCAMAFSSRDTLKPCSRRDKVERTTPCFLAKWVYGIDLSVSASRLSVTASSSDIVALRYWGCKTGWLRCRNARYGACALPYSTSAPTVT
jgi:hypothetical protein